MNHGGLMMMMIGDNVCMVIVLLMNPLSFVVIDTFLLVVVETVGRSSSGRRVPITLAGVCFPEHPTHQVASSIFSWGEYVAALFMLLLAVVMLLLPPQPVLTLLLPPWLGRKWQHHLATSASLVFLLWHAIRSTGQHKWWMRLAAAFSMLCRRMFVSAFCIGCVTLTLGFSFLSFWIAVVWMETRALYKTTSCDDQI